MQFDETTKAKLRVLKYKLLAKSELAERLTGRTFSLLLELGEILKTSGIVLYSKNEKGRLVFEDEEKGWKFALHLSGVGMGADHLYARDKPEVSYQLNIYPLEMLPTAAKKDLLAKYPEFIKGFLVGFRKMDEEFKANHKELETVLDYLVNPFARI